MYPKLRKPGNGQSSALELCLVLHLHGSQWTAGFVLSGSSPTPSQSQPRERSGHLPTSIRPNFRPDGTHTPEKKITLLALILLLTIYWLLSFFGQSTVRGVPHIPGLTDMLSVVIVVLIIVRFFS